MSTHNVTTSKNRPDKGASSSAASSSQVVGSHDAFRHVDKLVAKPTFGSDGARAWQTFRSNAASDGEAKARIANANKASSLGSAPLAPLKKLDRLQFASWKDEVEHEKSVRHHEGSSELHSGYQLFHEKHKKKKGSDAEAEGGGAAAATASSRKRGFGDDASTTESAAAATAAEEPLHSKKKKKSKSSKVAATMVDTPDHPLQQVAEAIRRRNAAAAAAAGTSGGAGLPMGWEAAVDSNTHQTYYYNRATNQRQWTVPVEAAATASASTTDATDTADPTDASASTSELPPGWVSVMDPTTHKQYYYHQATRETRWDRPAAS